MKKIFLIATIGIATSISAKPAEVKLNEKSIENTKETFDLCGVNVNFYDSEGNFTGSQWYVTDASSLSSCQAWQSMVKWNLTQAGFRLTAP